VRVFSIELSDLFNVVKENSKSSGLFRDGIVLVVDGFPSAPERGDGVGSGGGGNGEKSEDGNSKDSLVHGVENDCYLILYWKVLMRIYREGWDK